MDRMTELFEAIKTGDGAEADRLLDLEPELIDARDEDGLSPVLIAVYYGQKDVAQRLLARGPTLDAFEAAAVGDTPRLTELLDADRSLVDAWSVDGYQALGLASFFGHLDAARLLLDRGARHDLPSRNSMTVMPLHSAAAGRHADVAQLLIDRGADVNVASHGGFTPLHAAGQNGDKELVDALLGAGARSAPVSADGETPADLADKAGHAEVAALLRAQ